MSFAAFLNENSPFDKPVQNEQKNTLKIENLDTFTRYSDAPKFKPKRPQFRNGGQSYRRNKPNLTVMDAESLELDQVISNQNFNLQQDLQSVSNSELLPATYSRIPINSVIDLGNSEADKAASNEQTVVVVDDLNDRADEPVIYKAIDLDRLNYDSSRRVSNKNSEIRNAKFRKELPIGKLAKNKPSYARNGARRLSLESINRLGNNKINIIRYDYSSHPDPQVATASYAAAPGNHYETASRPNDNGTKQGQSSFNNARRPINDAVARSEKAKANGGTRQSNAKLSTGPRGSEKPPVMVMDKEAQMRQSEYERIKRDKEKQWANLRIKSRNGFRTYYDDEADVLGIQCFTCLMSDCKRRCGRCGGCADLISCPTYCWICFIMPLLIMIAVAVVILCLVGANIITG